MKQFYIYLHDFYDIHTGWLSSQSRFQYNQLLTDLIDYLCQHDTGAALCKPENPFRSPSIHGFALHMYCWPLVMSGRTDEHILHLICNFLDAEHISYIASSETFCHFTELRIPPQETWIRSNGFRIDCKTNTLIHVQPALAPAED